MKRNLFESVKALPYTPGEAVFRLGALSAILAMGVTAADAGAEAVITLSHCDTEGGTYEAVLDERLFMDQTAVERDAKGKITGVSATVPVAAEDLLEIDIDLAGCNRYVSVNVAYTGNAAASCALVLGDYSHNPPA